MTLIVIGLCFILLLERGPGREHITIQSYMLAMIAGLGAIFAGILAVPPGARLLRARAPHRRPMVPGPALRRDRPRLAAAGWRLPYVQHLEVDGAEPEPDDGYPHRPTRPEPGEFRR